ncbi:GNAT family N-acetyltransferase [Argonema galeatum]|uniref:GNAT family N-acetyltransferase n=1 Tax=Argonema galeatum TaxID=2942762 RepID=UPI002012A60D|nr:GNAT family N-acetyltransferase [Argonema galeatum]MCL1466082.1 GNAT family N-acetyltransferase [Argonema galeatum A003/A1]
MKASFFSKSPTMPYTHRLATPEDAKAIAPLMSAFSQERESADPSMILKPKYDFEQYVAYQLTKPLSFCWVLEDNNKSIVGFFFAYTYDENPPATLPEELRQHQERENPFQPRRVGSVLGLYVQPKHRHPEAIKQLIEAGIQKAESLQVTDIDVLISAEQTGIQSLLERLGFQKAAVQYTRHYDIAKDAELPSLHPPHPELPEVTPPAPSAIPLRDPHTNELVRKPNGEPIFLMPLRDEKGELILTADNLPIYPTPLRDPKENNWVFDASGELVVCPVLRDESDRIMEHQGIVQFHPPAYELVEGGLRLKRDAEGNCVFCQVERGKDGKIVRSPDGMPVFKQPLLV